MGARRTQRRAAKPCGVCTARRSGAVDGGDDRARRPRPLDVSATGITGTTAACPARTASTTRARPPAGTGTGRRRGRAPTSASPSSAASAAATEPTRSSPPGTTVDAADRPRARTHRVLVAVGRGHDDDTPHTPAASRPSHGAGDQSRTPPTGASALGTAEPETLTSSRSRDERRRPRHRGVTADQDGGGQHLVEQRPRPPLVGALGQRQLADQDLPSLGEHPLLAGGQAAVLLAAPEVAHDLGHLVHVAGGELLEVRLVPARPVGRLLGVRRAQHLEHPVQTLLANHVADADDLGVVRGNPDGQVALRNLEDEVLLLLALDRPGLDGLDESGTVVRVDDGLADLENHVSSSPFRYPQVNTPGAAVSQGIDAVFAGQGLDKSASRRARPRERRAPRGPGRRHRVLRCRCARRALPGHPTERTLPTMSRRPRGTRPALVVATLLTAGLALAGLQRRHRDPDRHHRLRRPTARPDRSAAIAPPRRLRSTPVRRAPCPRARRVPRSLRGRSSTQARRRPTGSCRCTVAVRA